MPTPTAFANVHSDYFLGMAADTKPTTAKEGSRFIEADTGLEFIMAGGSWYQIGKISVSLTTSDIAIGAIELKNDTTDDRAKVAALADNYANPTTLLVGALNSVWDGATWDRLPGDSTNGAKVQVMTAIPAGTNNIGDVDVLTLPALAAGTNNIGDVDVLTLPALAAGTNNIGDVDVLSIAAGETHVGEVGQGGDVIQITPTLDTAIYAAGDVLFDSTVITNAVRVAGGRAELISVTVLDEDDQAAADIDLYFLRTNVSLGTANAAPSITDANAREILGHLNIPSGNFKDLGGSKVATVRDVGLLLEPTSGRDLYVAGITAGTPTQTASGIRVSFGFRWY